MAGTTNYPGALDDYAERTNGVDTIEADDVNDLQAAIEAVQGELGTNPSGASATVVARLDALDSTVAGKLGAGAGAVGTSNLADGAVTAVKVAADVATQAELDAVSAALAGKAASSHAHAATDVTSGVLPIARGGTGGGDAAAARSALGLGSAATMTPAALAADSAFTGTFGLRAPDWVTGRAYVVGELVYSGSSLFRCATAHTSGGSFDGSKFTALGGGGGAVSSVVGQTGAVTGAQIAADSALTGTYGRLAGPNAWTGTQDFTGATVAGLSGGSSGDATTVAYDVIIAAGQSNMAGGPNAAGINATRYDIQDPRIFQWGRVGSFANQITLAREPLDYPDGTSGMGPALQFARWYVDTLGPGRRVLVVPVAHGDTGFSTSGTSIDGVGKSWDPAGSGNLYTSAIAQANAAIAAAGGGARVAAILWLQGEADVAMTASAYQAKLDALIAGMRAGITGAGSAPFVIGPMLPEFQVGGAGQQAIVGVHAGVPARIDYTGYAALTTTGLGTGDGSHYTAAGQRIVGRLMWQAYLIARTSVVTGPAAPAKVGAVGVTPGDTQVTLSWATPGQGSSPITDYVVQYRTTSGPGAWTTFADGASASTGATVTGLTNGTSYDFQVAAVNAVGTGAYSDPSTATPALPVESLFSHTSLPAGFGTAASNIITGLAITIGRSGTITAIWVPVGGGNTGISGSSVGVYASTSATTPATSQTFTTGASIGWQRVALTSPVAVTAGQTIVTALHIPGRFGLTTSVTWPVSNGASLTAPSGANGRYVSGTALAAPTTVDATYNYSVDIELT